MASDQLTWYGVHAQRGLPAFKDHGILLNLIGTAVHDCWGPYWQLLCAHGLCNAHLLRELTFQRETHAPTLAPAHDGPVDPRP